MGTHETFDHTADVGLRLRAADIDDLFQTAAEALFDYVVANREEVQGVESEALDLTANSTADLLMAWLNELLFRMETQHCLYGNFEVQVSPDGRSLRATISGEPIDSSRHQLDHEVKAITRHGFILKRDGSGWAAEIILDI